MCLTGGGAQEPAIGSANFAKLLFFLSVLSSTVTVLLSFSLFNVLGNHEWMKQCFWSVRKT